MADPSWERELHEAIERIGVHARAQPDLTGLEQALGRGNISSGEFEDGENEFNRRALAISGEMATIERLADSDPASFRAFLQSRIDEMDRALAVLPGSAVKNRSFLEALIPDLKETLVARLEGRPPARELSWALWVSGDVLRQL